jgi:hypothetical protein
VTDDAPAATAGAKSATSAGEPGEARGERAGKPLRPTHIGLEASWQRPAGWCLFGVVVGGLLIHGLGTVGVWVGIALVASGVYQAWQLVRTLRHPAGTIMVSDREVVLPRGLSLPHPVVTTPSEITAIYFLRRAVPWNRTAPVLVVELGERAMLFPRDWFASEADQRHVIHAVQRAKGESPRAASAAGDPDAA